MFPEVEIFHFKVDMLTLMGASKLPSCKLGFGFQVAQVLRIHLPMIPGLGRSPGVGNGNLLQYSCLGNPMD